MTVDPAMDNITEQQSPTPDYGNDGIEMHLQNLTINMMQQYFKDMTFEGILAHMVLLIMSLLGLKVSDLARRKIMYLAQLFYWKLRGEVKTIVEEDIPKNKEQEKIMQLEEKILNLENYVNSLAMEKSKTGLSEQEIYERFHNMYDLIKNESTSKLTSLERKLEDQNWRLAILAERRMQPQTGINVQSMASSGVNKIYTIQEENNNKEDIM
nr:NSP4 protein [Rotavirus J]